MRENFEENLHNPVTALANPEGYAGVASSLRILKKQKAKREERRRERKRKLVVCLFDFCLYTPQ